MASAAKKFAKSAVDYPEETVPVVSVQDWVRSNSSNPKTAVLSYLKGLFPILSWIGRYNLTWAVGDIIAGLTVGLVAVPQSMSYAVIATLPPAYGLYSSFVGVLIYCFFATSKDVSIGPVAVMSLTVGNIIKHVQNSHGKRWDGPQIAVTISFVCGFIVLGIGLLRLGWIVEFIPAPAVSGFMTGSAISIVAGQVPALMGITGFDTRAATYKVIINTLKGLPRTKLDAAFGLTGLVCLYIIRYICEVLTKKYPRRARLFFFISVLRNGFVILVLSLASFLYCRTREVKGKYPIKILGNVPRGFQHLGSPTIDPDLVSALGGQLPMATIILLLEHIAISKSFGRVNGYKINPNQELIAIGVTNTVGTLFGAYPATGSFSRSAIKSKSGVRTPLAGTVTALVVVVALYGLTPAFKWIPSSGLSALIIHAVADLVATPAQVFRFWRVSPLEFAIWLAAVLVTIFSAIENGIYTACASSLALLLVRIARPRGKFLGKVRVRRRDAETYDVFVPLHNQGGVLNPHLTVDPPAPGVIVYRFEESVLYPNSSLVNAQITDYAKLHTRRGKPLASTRVGDRPWNEAGPRTASEDDNTKAVLHAVVFDFSSVSNVDTTAVQALVDTRAELERWADRPVEFHFATILSPWIRRALVAGNFGSGTPAGNGAEIAGVVPYREGHRDETIQEAERAGDVESSPRGDDKGAQVGVQPRVRDSFDTLVPHDTPFFHFDLHSAVQAAELGAQASPSSPQDRSSFKGSI